MHPLYKDIAYVRAIQELEEAERLQQEIRNKIFRANRTIEIKEQEFREKHPNYPEGYSEDGQ